MKRHYSVIGIILILYLMWARFINAETLTLSTFYPAPFGVYNVLRLVPMEEKFACNDNLEGAFFMSTKGELNLCWHGRAENLLEPLIITDRFHASQIRLLREELARLVKEITREVKKLLEPLYAADERQEQRIKDLEKQLEDYEKDFEKKINEIKALANQCLVIEIVTTCPGSAGTN